MATTNPYESPEAMSVPPTRGATIMLWSGRMVSGLMAAMLIFSGVMKLMKPEMVIKGFTDLGYSPDLAIGIGILEIACVVVYLIPQTAVLGAILLTGYLGGATATHVRVGDPWLGPVILGMLVWLGVYLRDARLRALIPFRR